MSRRPRDVRAMLGALDAANEQAEASGAGVAALEVVPNEPESAPAAASAARTPRAARPPKPVHSAAELIAKLEPEPEEEPREFFSGRVPASLKKQVDDLCHARGIQKQDFLTAALALLIEEFDRKRR